VKPPALLFSAIFRVSSAYRGNQTLHEIAAN